MAVEKATTRMTPLGSPSAADFAASAQRSTAWNASGAASIIAWPAAVRTTPRPAGASKRTPTCRSNRLIC